MHGDARGEGPEGEGVSDRRPNLSPHLVWAVFLLLVVTIGAATALVLTGHGDVVGKGMLGLFLLAVLGGLLLL